MAITAISVGVVVSFKEKKARKNKGIKEEAKMPKQNKAKLELESLAAENEN